MNEIRSVAYFVQENRGSDREQEKEINIRQHYLVISKNRGKDRTKEREK